jgi:hypothetical protein
MVEWGWFWNVGSCQQQQHLFIWLYVIETQGWIEGSDSAIQNSEVNNV